jgi:hypothetical protein
MVGSLENFSRISMSSCKLHLSRSSNGTLISLRICTYYICSSFVIISVSLFSIALRVSQDLSITSCIYLIVSSWFFCCGRFLKDKTSYIRRSTFSFEASCLSNFAMNSLCLIFLCGYKGSNGTF